MAQLHINNISIGNNPASVLSPFQLDITFQCFSDLPGTLDWKIIYIGSPSNNQNDQVIDSFDMDHLTTGVMNFQVESNPPNFSLIPQDQIVGKCFSIQVPLPFCCQFLMKNRNSLELDTTLEINMTRAFKFLKFPLLITLKDIFYPITQEFLDFKSNGQLRRVKQFKTCRCFKRISKLWEGILFNPPMELYNSSMNLIIRTECLIID